MKLATLLKPALIAGLALALYVPVTMIQGLVFERQARAQQAVANIAQGWDGRQTLAGPYLVVPYERTRVTIVQEMPWRKLELIDTCPYADRNRNECQQEQEACPR